MLDETRSILAVLYRDFWSTPEKKEIILQKEKIERDVYQNELRKKYNPDNIFQNNSQLIKRKIQDNSTDSKVFNNNVAMVEYKESIFKKIMDKIKNILHLN